MGDVIAEDVTQFYEFTKVVLLRYASYAHPQNRPIVYIFVACEQPRVEFVIRSSDPNLVLSAILLEKLGVPMSHVKQLEQTLAAVHIQFMLNDREEWEFNYLLTRTGGVIGSEQAYSSRFKKIKMLFSSEEKSVNNPNDAN